MPRLLNFWIQVLSFVNIQLSWGRESQGVWKASNGHKGDVARLTMLKREDSPQIFYLDIVVLS